MNSLITILKNFIPKTLPKPLGRWNNDCYMKTNKKIDFANEDHCGPCGENLLNTNVVNSPVKLYTNKNVLNKEIIIFKQPK
jgi:hypothetical protein